MQNLALYLLVYFCCYKVLVQLNILVRQKNPMTTEHSSIRTAKKVIATEINGLQSISDWLGDDFVKAVQILKNCKGKIILSGMGKSGHIGNKISATFASTGSPAFFVHPGEASHGDLGMIAQDDVVILLSNSGETSELTDIVDYSRRFSIPLISIVRRERSALVTASDVALILPEVEEACTVNAPTTSTTMMLALGDALAVALLEEKSFTKEEYRVFHPGGKLGAALLRVKDLMHNGEELPVVSSNDIMSEVLIEMSQKGFGCAAVVDSAMTLEGIITDGDLRRHMSTEMVSQPAKNIMTRNPVTTTETTLASAVLAIMQERTITSLMVLDKKGILRGIVHIHDLLRAGVI
jgi:arabinose-5-phosphate isomerase